MGRTLLLLLATGPVPRDLQLPLPVHPDALEVFLVALFLLHILFVNLMVGGAVLTAVFELIGLSRPRYDTLAKRIAETVTVNKSLAVVLGVGPLLCINLLYTAQFYSANALTGQAWISIVPLVILAFLLTYLHKYTWDRWTGSLKVHHIVHGVFTAVLFLSIPVIFVANINLMLFPSAWADVEGFFSSLSVGNAFPRLFHFITASLAVTGIFLAGWFGRKGYPVAEKLPDFSAGELRLCFYRIAFFVTFAQIVFGPLLFLTLPSQGLSGSLVWLIGTGVLVAILVLTQLWQEIRSSNERLGRRYVAIVGLMILLVTAMGTGRHVYRENMLEGHKRLMADRTSAFRSVELAATMRQEAGLGIGEALASGPTGASIFKNCAACHAVDRVLAAPSLREVYRIYGGNPEGIVTWARDPGKKRAEFGPMPSFAHLGDENLRLVADYILDLAAPPDSTTSSVDTPEAAH